VTDVCVIGLPDCHWGQVVTAIYVPKHSKVSRDILQTEIQQKLSKFKRPKHWLPVESLPRNSQGKINYEHLKQLAMMGRLPHATGAAIE
jgi:o-succinylbenzoate---CoA ligase